MESSGFICLGIEMVSIYKRRIKMELKKLKVMALSGLGLLPIGFLVLARTRLEAIALYNMRPRRVV